MGNLGNKSFGLKKTDRATELKTTWDVPYQAGELKVIGYTAGQKVNASILRTANNAVQIRITADRKGIISNGQGLSYITVELIDNIGILNLKAENLLNFEIEGPDTIFAVGNANPISTVSSIGNKR